MLPILDSRTFTPATTPRAGLTALAALSIFSVSVLTLCLSRKLKGLKTWRRLRLTHWLILAIYCDSILFVIVTSILTNGFGLNTSQNTCSAAIWLCLIFYMSTKILIYYLFVEKVHVVNAVAKPRMKSKLYIFNCFGMLVPYCIVAILNFVFRIARFTEEGVCIIGMERKAMIPLIIFDVIVNVYLTVLFIIPLRKQHSYQNNADSALRTVTFRTFIGSVGTLTSSIVNLTVVMVLQGEPAWICFICCNTEILFSVVVLHWVTSKDKPKGSTLSRSRTANQCSGGCNSIPLSDSSLKRSVVGAKALGRADEPTPDFTSDMTREDDEICMISDVKRQDSFKVESVKTASVKTQDISWPDSPESEGKGWRNDSPV
ncbi:hypothetical protein PVAG01_09531 [Phlyctema vagabunda]|uniref:Uncharacterized protein n=1 Tax=Phlyctema vagabunda TaxID=108571 RepID=A0ABR4P7Q2_9HELO